MRHAVLILLGTTTVAAAEPRLRKDDVRPAIKTITPKLDGCYTKALERDPKLAGVVNTKLTIRSDDKGLTLKVRGFDTKGTIAGSREFLACATALFESAKPAAIAARGTLNMTYPTTFATVPVDNKDTSSVDRASRALDAARFTDALVEAERGLELTSLDGTYRRRLIGIAGLAACQAKNADKARAYFELAPQDAEEGLAKSCAKVGIALP